MQQRKNTRAAHGVGSIRHRKGGRWEARYTVGVNPITGKQDQRSEYGKTKKEASEKMMAKLAEINNGTYSEPSKLTVADWIDLWTTTYLGDVKPRTSDSYESICRLYLKPALGAVRLQKLSSPAIQTMYNTLQRDKELSPKTIKCVHGVLHKLLNKAVELEHIRRNPSEACVLPRAVRRDMTMLPDDAISDFLSAIQGHQYETLFFVDLFTGMRQGEILGLSWDAIDFEVGTILINKQLQRKRGTGGEYILMSTKSNKLRKITAADAVMKKLKEQKIKQTEMQLLCGEQWNNPYNLVFTNEFGRNCAPTTVYKHLKKVVASIGMPQTRFHDLRHSFAVVSLQNGDDIKTIQDNLGHYDAAFTLNTYGHSTGRMKRDSADRMDSFIKTAQKCG